MNKKQKIAIALMCAVAALLAASMLLPSMPWRQPAAPAQQGHEAHQDAHGHDDRHAETPTAEGATADGAITMTEAQIKANGIGLDVAGPAAIQERLHLPAQVKVDAERSVAIAAQVTGLVQAVRVSPGTVVKKGDPLVLLQSPDIAQWRADHASAQARLALARTVFQREQALWEQHISARQDLDQARTALREAEIAVQAARQRLQALGIAVTGERGAGEGATGTAVIRAPLAGVVLERPAVPGMAVDPSKPLATIADLSRVWIEAAVPTEHLAQVRVKMPARISATALAQELEGSVAFIDSVLGETTRMATARIELPNPGLRLRPGMLASVDLMGRQAEAAVTVAVDAVQTIHERTVVFVRTPTGFAPRTVVLGRSDGKRSEIVQGLDAGSRYAASGSYLLKADLGKSEAGHDD